MTTWAEVLHDGTRGRKESLGVARRFNPLHAPLPLTRGLMRVLRMVVEIEMLAMFYPWKNLFAAVLSRRLYTRISSTFPF